ncbi:MAG TPA: hypothetical protein VFQ23_11220, partial [Anaerolineales bacterium]|nr:hypothetical protein [Anaerolineales bacterium]
MKTYILKPALFLWIVFSLLTGACGASPATEVPTSTATSTLVPTITPTITLTPTKTPTPTATPNLTATQQYNDFAALVQKIYDAGQISTTEGSYARVDDFSDALAMDYGYSWFPTGIQAKDFILRAQFDWEVANQKNFSGCGYIFRQESDQYYYLIVLDAINGVFLSYTKQGIASTGAGGIVNYTLAAAKKERLPDMGANPYQAEFTLVVNDNSAYTYVNGD